MKAVLRLHVTEPNPNYFISCMLPSILQDSNCGASQDGAIKDK